MPTPRTIPAAVSSARILRAASWRVAIEEKERIAQSVRTRARRSFSLTRRASPPSTSPGDLPVLQEDDPLRRRRRVGIVRDHHDRVALGAVELAEQVEDLGARARVEVAGGLVGEHELGLEQERAGDRDALLLAARELRGQVVAPRPEPDALEQLDRAGPRRVVAAAGDQGRQDDVLLGAQRRQQVEELEDEADRLAAKQGELALAEALEAPARRARSCRPSASRARRAGAAACSSPSPTGP